MKIVNRKTFLAMPPETLYSKYKPSYFEELCIKGETLSSNDFCYQEIIDAVNASSSEAMVALLDQSQEYGSSVPMDFNCQSRDGCFDDDQLFAVWEEADVLKLSTRICRALMDGYLT